MFCEPWWAREVCGRCETLGYVWSVHRISETGLWVGAGIITGLVGGTEVGLRQLATLLVLVCKHWAKVTME